MAKSVNEFYSGSKIEIYTKQNCVWCTRAKSFFEKNGVAFAEHPIDGNYFLNRFRLEERLGMSETSEKYTLPQIFIDGNHVGGFTDLMEEVTDMDLI